MIYGCFSRGWEASKPAGSTFCLDQRTLHDESFSMASDISGSLGSPAKSCRRLEKCCPPDWFACAAGEEVCFDFLALQI